MLVCYFAILLFSLGGAILKLIFGDMQHAILLFMLFSRFVVNLRSVCYFVLSLRGHAIYLFMTMGKIA